MYPWLVRGRPVRVMIPATLISGPQVDPPFVEDMAATANLHLDGLQLLFRNTYETTVRWPAVTWSAPMPGTKKLATADVPTKGTRFTDDHEVPLVEVLNTMSLALQPLRKRQSLHAT